MYLSHGRAGIRLSFHPIVELCRLRYRRSQGDKAVEGITVGGCPDIAFGIARLRKHLLGFQLLPAYDYTTTEPERKLTASLTFLVIVTSPLQIAKM